MHSPLPFQRQREELHSHCNWLIYLSLCRQLLQKIAFHYHPNNNKTYLLTQLGTIGFITG